MANESMRRCPKCGSSQELGFGLDVGHSQYSPARWLAGPPESSWWQGVKTSGIECRRIDYWRCTRCGFLEAYAVESVDPPGFFKA
jgi:predicted nucleic-acid-binding Zn-ribbon protein